MSDSLFDRVAIIGGGPAGLMAADRLARAGVPVTVYEAKPSLGRKFLRAGIGGLNLTHAEDYELFCRRYFDRASCLQPMLDMFPPSAVRDWAADLGVETFEGSSGRVFPVDMKAAPLLRAWVHRLRALGVQFRLRHRWVGWDESGAWRLQGTEEMISIRPRAVVLALGGGSWPQLGSDAAWVPWLQEKGVQIAPLQSANCGFEVEWSPHFRERFSGAELKPVALTCIDEQGVAHTRRGEFVVSDYGVEGSLIYTFSRQLREAIRQHGRVSVTLDLVPDRDAAKVQEELDRPRGARSMSSHLQSRLGLKGVKAALLRELLGQEGYADTRRLAQAVKSLPLTLEAARPMAEAISTAGGVSFASLDEHLMLQALPGVFVAGEMLDWEAPTGGYLLTACLAQGAWVAEGVRHYLK